MIGNVRDSFARALLEKAVETVDRRAGLRTASAACCSALVLLEFLVTCESLNLAVLESWSRRLTMYL